MRRIAVAATFVSLLAVQVLRPLPTPVVERTLSGEIVLPGTVPAMPWPARGQAAVTVEGIGTLGSSGGNDPVPIASIAKVMTAVVVLRHHPLGEASDGPAITVGPADVARYRASAGSSESLLPVESGERLSLREALDALLVASANNVATMLAIWDAGTEQRFVDGMNAMARELGMPRTAYADASGLDPRTVSTASDQIVLAQAAMRDRTFAQIVGQRFVDLPLAGRVPNYNSLVGSDAVVGVKTGSSSAAGGCLVFAVDDDVAGERVRIFGVLLGQRDGPFLPTALARAKALASAARAAVEEKTALAEGAAVGRVRARWGATAPLVVSGPVRVVGWAGLAVRTRIRTRASARSVATFEIAAGERSASADVVVSGDVPGPSLRWRLTRLRSDDRQDNAGRP